MTELKQIIDRLDAIEARLLKLEQSNQRDEPPLPTTTNKIEEVKTKTIEEVTTKTVTEPQRKSDSLEQIIDKPILNELLNDEYPSVADTGRDFLGLVGVGCILLASLLLIKFTIDSGWLTPFRQLLLAGLFGTSLISVPFFAHFEDKKYISQLPAVGVTVLNLVVYGAVFYHQLMGPLLGLICISAIGFLSLWLLQKVGEELYAGLSIIGTYSGIFFLSTAFQNIYPVGIFLMVWDVTFVLYAIRLQRRQMIIVAGYLALGLIGLWGAGADDKELSRIIVIQMLQFLVFAQGTSLFSTINKQILTTKETWQFFPLVIFFYGQMYYFFDCIDHVYATIFALGFAALFWGIYTFAQKKLDQTLESRDMVYTAITLVLAHSIYINEFTDFWRMVTVLIFLGSFTFIKEKIDQLALPPGSMITIGIFVLLAYLSVLFDSQSFSMTSLLIFGGLFGTFGFIIRGTIKGPKSSLIMYLAHAQMMTCIWRLKAYLPEVYIAPLWILYAFGILLWALKKEDELLAKSFLPLVVFGLGRFMIFQFADLGSLQKIASLFVMGGLIFAGGYLYRRIVKT